MISADTLCKDGKTALWLPRHLPGECDQSIAGVCHAAPRGAKEKAPYRHRIEASANTRRSITNLTTWGRCPGKRACVLTKALLRCFSCWASMSASAAVLVAAPGKAHGPCAGAEEDGCSSALAVSYDWRYAALEPGTSLESGGG